MNRMTDLLGLNPSEGSIESITTHYKTKKYGGQL